MSIPEGKNLSVFQALMLALALATLVVEILKFNQKK